MLNNVSFVVQEKCVTADEVEMVAQSTIQKELSTGLEAMQSQLQVQMTMLSSEITNRFEAILQRIVPTYPIGSFENPASSCKQIPQNQPSGNYWIQTNAERNCFKSIQYCDMSRRCGTRGWMRVANLDMTDSRQGCPSGFRLVTSPIHLCGRPGPAGCASTVFSVHGIEYSNVCGKVKAYQYGSTDALKPYYLNPQRTIDDVYVDGVSLTHGYRPRKHIWTFVANENEDTHRCPCTRTDRMFSYTLPPFIGQDYFCETASPSGSSTRVYTEDPLWDGYGCGSRSSCCRFNNPPWFHKVLPYSTDENIELRLCADQNTWNEDVPIEQVEIYVQ